MDTYVMSSQEEKEAQKKAKQNLLWVALVSIIMLFAGLTSAYVVRMAEGNWMQFELPMMFYFSTGIILISSLTMNMAMKAVKKNAKGAVTNYLFITFALGIAFVLLQFGGWRELTDQGVFFAGSDANASGSYLYVLSGVHLAHVAGGLIALLIVGIYSLRGAYDSDNYLGLKLTSVYWHFLDILWVYLFLFLLFIR
jgi:cytochrome c oxidase subunit III